MRLKNVPFYVRVLCACAALSFIHCSLDLAGGSTETTNPRVCGILYNPQGSPAENARVIIISAAHNPLTASAPQSIVDTTYTDSTGTYRLNRPASGSYNIFGEGDSGVSYSPVAINQDSTTILPPDTLRQPGSVSGVIRLQPQHSSRTVLILVFGSLVWTMPYDSIGNFTLANMAEGTYTARFLTTLDDYSPLDTTLPVRAGMNDTLPDTLHMPFTGIPTPHGLTLAYDTANQVVTLTWHTPANTGPVTGYNVFRETNDTGLMQLNTAAITDTFFLDSLSGGPAYDQTCSYYVTAIGINGHEGDPCPVCFITILGNSRGWSPKNPMAPRKEHTCLIIDTIMYCVGGVNESGALQSLMKYNPASDTWENLAPIPEPRTGASACAAGGRIYYFGGQSGVGWNISNYEYTISSDIWSLKQNRFSLIKYMSSCENDNNVYIIGGDRFSGGICDSLYVYNPFHTYPIVISFQARTSYSYQI